MLPVTPNSAPFTTWLPCNTCAGSSGSTPGVRALVFSTRNSAPRSSSREPSLAHFVPTSVVYFGVLESQTFGVTTVEGDAVYLLALRSGKIDN